ncbi:WD40 repeat-like protein [Polyplosphaeria fusca]|uniref:Ribosome biogenesis protein YTM1 n=1 Tax=Polyplosphaeria fusca TaxID=682080 RepID=A0A9P4QZ36_9PLEO|nr:WD40 repeat-like protein [Polyplosphaeria fusca]
MPSQVSEKELGAAILQSVQHGSFPQSEHVASANVPSTALPRLLEVLAKAREERKDEIRKVSREAGDDVDGWTTQARKLQDDIKRSQETAQEIVQQANAGKEYTAKVQDATAKVSFLYSEIAYNESLVQIVEQMRDISSLLESAQEAAVNGHIILALDRVEDANATLKRIGAAEHTRVASLLKSKADQLRSAIIENTSELWNGLVVVDATERRISLKEEVQRESLVHINTVVEALTKLGKMETLLSLLSREFDDVILSPRLTIKEDRIVSAIQIDGDNIQSTGKISDMSVRATLEDIQVIGEYLSTRLPPAVAVPLSDKLLTILSSRLISNWLLPAVPLSTEGVLDFQDILSLVLGLCEFFDELEWTGQKRLSDWVDRSAQIWLSRRKEAAIAKVRSIMPRRVKDKKTVERVETQVISKGDAMLGNQEEQDEDWGADWGEEEEPTKQNSQEEIEEEDMSAWGADDDEPPPEANPEPKTADTEHEDDQEEDWGADWGDEEESKPTTVSQPARQREENKSNGKPLALQKAPKKQEVTLRETYTVTAIPDSIMEIIIQVVLDVATLNQPDLVGSAIAPASGGLFAIPGQLLAMYRATAAIYYSKDAAGNMLIYNDCTRLADRLRKFLHEQVEKDSTSKLPQYLRPSVRLKLEGDIESLQSFGRRAYGREMELQRTIIRDFLDAASGFQGCTTDHYAAECDNAVAMTIDRLEDVKRQWKDVLSHSALLQSLGSVVSTAITKFINDIEELSDIGEDESRKLHGYGKSLSSLGAHFQTEDESGEMRDMAAMYVRNWMKFQYLLEILEGSLADIRYFWANGLDLEMDAEEVVDLIKALFAESEHRRKAIALRRIALSSLVNNLLHTEKPIPFEFLVNGQFLRTSIEDFLTANGISAETTLNVEYTRALIPPLHVASFEHDDWISDVDVLSHTSPAGAWSKPGSIQSGQERILSASYDGLLRVWNLSGDVIATSTAPNNGGRITSLKSAKWLSETKIVAAGMDNVVRVYKYDEDSRSIQCNLELYAHRWPIENLAVHGPSNRILSASTDSTVSLFSPTSKDAPPAPPTLLPSSTPASHKRQKLSKPDRTIPSRGPLATLSGHTAPVSATLFHPSDPTAAYSASRDHALKTWDLTTAACVDTRTTSHALLCLTALPALSLVATGTAARHITLTDPRATATSISALTLRGHTNAVVALDTDPGSEYGLVSGGHDGTVRIWDVRSVRSGVGEERVGEAVYTISRESVGGSKVRSSGEGVKVFGVCWDGVVGVVSAGEDRRVQVNSGGGA